MQIAVEPTTTLTNDILPAELRGLLRKLHAEFEPRRQELLAARKATQREYDLGHTPKFENHHVAKTTEWKVAPIPQDLLDRRVEITGPVSNTKMVINMLSENGDGEIASTAMLDFEDSMAPTWANVRAGLENLVGIASGRLRTVENGKVYELNPRRMAVPMVRVRGLHLVERHAINEPLSAGLFDLTASAFHIAREFVRLGRTPKFYVPKCEHYLEARWWNDLFRAVEDGLGLRRGALRVTFLIETLPASFQMEEILYEVRERACGLNGGRWDKIFSDIKTLRLHPDRVLADRASIDMSRPWMDAYSKLLVKTCHKHGAYAMGGMSAFTPGKDPETRKRQLSKVVADKKREAANGHDGCWVSHPFFIGIAKAQFPYPNQLAVRLDDFPSEPHLLPEPMGPKTRDGLRQNIRVGIAYQFGWDRGLGCVAFENLMEDLATLEISRAQVWQWLHHRVTLDCGTKVSPELVSRLFDEELETILADLPTHAPERTGYRAAKEKIETVYFRPELTDFFIHAH